MEPTRVSSEFLTSIRSTEYPNGQMKLVICTKRVCNSAKLTIADTECAEFFNDVEPFDPYTHVFWFPRELLTKAQPFRMTFRNTDKKSPYFREVGEIGVVEALYSPDFEEDLNKAIAAADNGIKIQSVAETEVADGIISRT